MGEKTYNMPTTRIDADKRKRPTAEDYESHVSLNLDAPVAETNCVGIPAEAFLFRNKSHFVSLEGAGVTDLFPPDQMRAEIDAMMAQNYRLLASGEKSRLNPPKWQPYGLKKDYLHERIFAPMANPFPAESPSDSEWVNIRFASLTNRFLTDEPPIIKPSYLILLSADFKKIDYKPDPAMPERTFASATGGMELGSDYTAFRGTIMIPEIVKFGRFAVGAGVNLVEGTPLHSLKATTSPKLDERGKIITSSDGKVATKTDVDDSYFNYKRFDFIGRVAFDILTTRNLDIEAVAQGGYSRSNIGRDWHNSAIVEAGLKAGFFRAFLPENLEIFAYAGASKRFGEPTSTGYSATTSPKSNVTVREETENRDYSQNLAFGLGLGYWR